MFRQKAKRSSGKEEIVAGASWFSVRLRVDPEMMGGQPVVEGTRVLLSTVLGELAEEQSVQQIADDYNIDVAKVVRALNNLANALCPKEE